MSLNRDKWYVRWYFWSLGICEEFTEKDYLLDRAEQRGTNLCAFMRVILIYTPLIFLLHTIVYVSALAAIVVLPIWLFGLKGFGVGVGVVVAFLLLLFVAVNLSLTLSDKRKATKRALAKERAAKTTNTDTTSPGFVNVLGQWVSAKKRKVCPLITFTKSDKEVL